MERCEEYIARFFWDVHSDRWKTQVQFTEGCCDSILGKHEDNQTLEILVQRTYGVSTGRDIPHSTQTEQHEQYWAK